MALIESFVDNLVSSYAGQKSYQDDTSSSPSSPGESEWPNNVRQRQPRQIGESFIEDIIDQRQQEITRQNRAVRDSSQDENNAGSSGQDSNFGGNNIKRVAFTPRIGR